MSYAHADDEYDNGAITKLAKRLELALRAFTGQGSLNVFFDRNSIEWGDTWRSRIEEGLEDSAILIAIVTPSYLASDECRRELEAFSSASGREHSLLPIYYIEIEGFQEREDPFCTALRDQQYEDWTQLRELGPTSLKVRRAVEKLAKRLRDLLREPRREEQARAPILSHDSSREFRAEPTWSDSEEGDWYDHVLVAQSAADAEEYALARALLLSAMDRFDNPEIAHELAIVDWYDGALEDAITGFEKALEAGVDEVDIKLGLGQARIELGLYEQGVEDLTFVMENSTDPDSAAYSRSTRALGLAGLGQFEEAMAELATAEELTPHNAWLHFNRAIVLDWQDDPRAIESYIQALIANVPPLNRPKREYAQQRLQEIENGEEPGHEP